MSALLVLGQVTEVGQDGLQDVQPLPGGADLEQFLDHVVAVLMHDEVNQVLLDVVDDLIEIPL